MLPDYLMERQDPDKKLFVSGNTTVPLSKRYVFVSDDADITLPNVSEAEGRKFIVAAETTQTIRVFTGGSGVGTTSISTTGVSVEFESTGREYITTRR